MKVLVCGAGGFIGRRIALRLAAAGHGVVRGVSGRSAPGPDDLVTDFAHDTAPERWRPRLRGIDAVVVAVGRLRDSASQPLHAVHADVPGALFEAAAAAGVARIVHISALGTDRGDTLYAVTKRAGEARLERVARAGLATTVLRPSVVYGRGGASTSLFTALARLPILPLPAAMRSARLQPVHVADLADAVAALLDPALGAPPVSPLAVVGPEATTFAGYIARLRAQLGHAPARVVSVPAALVDLSAWLGDQVPASPWCRQSIDLMREPNIGDPAPLARLLGRPPIALERFIATP